MIPIINTVKPLTKSEIDYYLNSKEATPVQKTLVAEVILKLEAIAEKYKIDKKRLLPMVDFDFNTSCVYLD